MKKLLACMLALILAIGCGVCAAAFPALEPSAAEFIASRQPLTALKPNEETALTQDIEVFSFTPVKSGYHMSIPSNEWVSLCLLDSNYEPVGINGLHGFFISGCYAAELAAGETYYFLVAGGQPITLYDGARRLDFWQGLGSFLSFGMVRQLWVNQLYKGGSALYAIPVTRAMLGGLPRFVLLPNNLFMLLSHVMYSLF